MLLHFRFDVASILWCGTVLISGTSFLKVRLMVQFVFGKLKLADVSKFGKLVAMSVILPGILHLIGLFLQLLCKSLLCSHILFLSVSFIFSYRSFYLMQGPWLDSSQCQGGEWRSANEGKRTPSHQWISSSRWCRWVMCKPSSVSSVFPPFQFSDATILIDDKKPVVRWVKHETLDGIMLIHHKVLYPDFLHEHYFLWVNISLFCFLTIS